MKFEIQNSIAEDIAFRRKLNHNDYDIFNVDF